TYIAAFVLFAVTICFWAFGKFKKIETPNLLVAPIFFWLLLCGLVSVYLQGASFFIVPVYALLVAFMVVINQKEPSAYVLVILALPALWIYAPFIKMFPIGLGLKMMVAASLLTTLTFFLLLPLFGFYKHKNRLAILGFVLFLGFMVSAHFNSGFTAEHAKPTSLLYVLDADTNSAQWATYEHELADWTAQYIGDNKKIPEKLADKTISSKYASGFTYVSEAPLKQISPPRIEITNDTIVGKERLLEICITPQRDVNRLEVFTNQIGLNKAIVNNIELSDHYLAHRRNGKLITHYISNNEYTELQLAFPKGNKLELTLYEASNDLLHNSKFTVPERPEDNIPMPFVLNDAILLTKTLTFE
ncbi:MAG: peptidase M28, partial [Maribacter sp.]|nr:peptidase M28 [Maribacter sp.]